MRTEHIGYLLTIANLKSINKAALALNHSPQNLSRIVGEIEDDLGFKIFKRSNKGVLLTENGQQFIDKAAKISDLMQEILSLRYRQNGQCTFPDKYGQLNIYGIYNSSNQNYLALIQNISVTFPNLMINISEESLPNIIKNVQEKPNSVGIATLVYPFEKNQSILPDDLTFIPAYYRNIYTIVASDNSFMAPQSVPLKTLVHYPLIIYQNTDISSAACYRLLANYGEPNVRYTTSNIDIFYQYLMQGGCYTLAVDCKTAYLPRNNNLVMLSLPDKVQYAFGLLINKRFMDDPLIKAFVDFYLKMVVSPNTW